MKLGSKERAFALYTGIFTIALTISYAGGLAARGQRDDHVRRSGVSLSSEAFSRASEGAAFSSILLGGAATVSQHRDP